MWFPLVQLCLFQWTCCLSCGVLRVLVYRTSLWVVFFCLWFLGLGLLFPKTILPVFHERMRVLEFVLFSFSIPSSFSSILKLHADFLMYHFFSWNLVSSIEERICFVRNRWLAFFPALFSRFGPEHRRLKTISNSIDINFENVKKISSSRF